MESVTFEQWIEGLRNSNYEQGKGGLYSYDDGGCYEGYCCLGVLASEMGFEKGKIKYYGYLHHIDNDINKQFEDFNLTVEVERFLSRLNDTAGFTFDEIADVLESDFDWDLIKEIYFSKENQYIGLDTLKEMYLEVKETE